MGNRFLGIGLICKALIALKFAIKPVSHIVSIHQFKVGTPICFIVDLRIKETRQTGAVFNSTYPDLSGSKPTGPDNKFTPIYRGDRNRGAKVCIYFVEFTINTYAPRK